MYPGYEIDLNNLMLSRTSIDDYENTAQKMKFSIKDCFIKCDQIFSFLRIWSHLLEKSLMEKFVFCAVEALQS